MGRAIWTFWEFETLGRRGVITEWVERLEMEAEEEFHGILRNLAVSPRKLWVRPAYDVLGPDIGEIRFKANGLQHRVFGSFLTSSGRYVMLVGATKKGRNYDPRDAINTARKREKLIARDRSQLREYTDYRF
jgi:hypothetical protein